MYVSRFRVDDFEVVVAAVLVGACHEIMVQFQNIPHQMSLELLHINPVALSFYKLPPREK